MSKARILEENPEIMVVEAPERPAAFPARALGAAAVGSLAVGALALGALAIGALVIGRLAVGHARFKSVEIDKLVVRELKVLER